MVNEEPEITVLQDRQLPQLRKRIKSLSKRVKELEAVYAFNEDSFRITSAILVAIQASESLPELDDVIQNALIEDVGDQACLFLLDRSAPLIGFQAMRLVSELTDREQEKLNGLTATIGEPCRQETFNCYLEGLESELGSIALVPAQHKDLRIALVIGSHNPATFNPDFGTVFLDLIAKSVAITVRRLLDE